MAKNQPLRFHYMRSCSQNPQQITAERCEYPLQIVRSCSSFDSQEANQFSRPINQRLYFTPSWWISELEREGKKGVMYTDYALCQGFHDFWKGMCASEERINRTHYANRSPPQKRVQPIRSQSLNGSGNRATTPAHAKTISFRDGGRGGGNPNKVCGRDPLVSSLTRMNNSNGFDVHRQQAQSRSSSKSSPDGSQGPRMRRK